MGFMSGLVSGFMDTGGGAALGTGGDVGSAASDTGASSISSDSSNVGTNMVDQSASQPAAKSGGGGIGGMMGGGGSSSTPAPSGGGAAGQVSPSTNLSTGAINRTNPYPASGQSTSQQVGQIAKQFGSSMSQPKAAIQQGQVNMPGNSYSALFGTQTQVGEYGGGRIGVQPMQMPQSTAPVAMPMAPQVPSMPPPAAPPAMMPATVSDVRAKYKIKSQEKSQQELDSFLQKIYDNVTSRGNK